jgi:hypothetical protein
MNWGDTGVQLVTLAVMIVGMCVFALIWTGDGS